jgi:hypothetical protein
VTSLVRVRLALVECGWPTLVGKPCEYEAWWDGRCYWHRKVQAMSNGGLPVASNGHHAGRLGRGGHGDRRGRYGVVGVDRAEGHPRSDLVADPAWRERARALGRAVVAMTEGASFSGPAKSRDSAGTARKTRPAGVAR